MITTFECDGSITIAYVGSGRAPMAKYMREKQRELNRQRFQLAIACGLRGAYCGGIFDDFIPSFVDVPADRIAYGVRLK